jgi:predicted ATP-dependent serine protease
MAIVKANEILKENYRFLKLSVAFSYILGSLPAERQWTMLLHGIAGGGKSTFALLIAKELTKFGNVLYGNLEERVGATLQAKLKLTKLRNNRRIHFLEPNTEDVFWEQLDKKLYKFAIVDSLSHIASQEKQVASFWEKARARPDVSFIFVCHALKSRDGKRETNYRGASTLGHIVDINQRVVDGVVWNDKNRLLGQETAKAKGFHIFRKILV